MKKAFALLLTLAMALGCLAGCGNGSASLAHNSRFRKDEKLWNCLSKSLC